MANNRENVFGTALSKVGELIGVVGSSTSFTAGLLLPELWFPAAIKALTALLSAVLPAVPE